MNEQNTFKPIPEPPLTRRERIAMEAMKCFPINAVLNTMDIKWPEKQGKHTSIEVANYRAALAVIQADALLAELAKEGKV